MGGSRVLTILTEKSLRSDSRWLCRSVPTGQTVSPQSQPANSEGKQDVSRENSAVDFSKVSPRPPPTPHPTYWPCCLRTTGGTRLCVFFKGWVTWEMATVGFSRREPDLFIGT